MLHEWIKIWFHWVESWGYGGVIVLMAMESSIFPVPSEIVMPPAAFWASQGKMSFWGVVGAGTFGSYLGSAITYWVARFAGFPMVRKYGKYFLLPEKKVLLAEAWIQQFGVGGVFLARLMPVVRHLISIPAGVFRMPFAAFSAVTIVGAGVWCTVLSWYGGKILGEHPELLQSPEDMSHVIKSQLIGLIAGVLVLAVLYAGVVWFKIRASSKSADTNGMSRDRSKRDSTVHSAL